MWKKRIPLVSRLRICDVCTKAPGLEGRTNDSRALGECRAYMDSLQNGQFILPHLHILHSSPLNERALVS